MVLVVAQNHLLEPLTDQRCRLMLPADQLHFDSFELCQHPLLRRLAPDDEAPVALVLPAVVREAQERESLRLSLAAPFPISFGMLPELNQPCLFRMQFQAELSQTFPEHIKKTLGFRPTLETYHKVVGGIRAHRRCGRTSTRIVDHNEAIFRKR